MLRNSHVWGIACLLIGCWSSVCSGQNIIVNGTFDTSVPSNGTGGGWTSFTIDGAGGWFSAGGNPGGRFVLNDSGQVATNPTIQQTIMGLTIGESYTISGDYRLHSAFSGNPANSFAVLVDSSSILQLSNPGTTWTPFSTTFIATNTSHQIGFEAERLGSDVSYMIDNISMMAVTVPEPGTWAMLGLTTLGGGVFYWCRGRKVKRSNTPHQGSK